MRTGSGEKQKAHMQATRQHLTAEAGEAGAGSRAALVEVVSEAYKFSENKLIKLLTARQRQPNLSS